MRIRSSNRTPYLSRRDQFRLAMLACLLGFVVIAMTQASRPETWYWLTGVPELQDDVESAGQPEPSVKVDFSVNAEPESLPDGVVQVVDRQPKAADALPDELAIDPELLAGIKDNSVGIRGTEWKVYYQLLAKARDTPVATLEKAARSDVPFSILMNESPKFIGTLLTIKGRLQRLTSYAAGKNDHGFDQLHEAWIETDDAGNNPYIVVCSRIPDGLLPSEQMAPDTDVRITGYYFKRFGYAAPEFRLHVAPLILAPELHWNRPRTPAETQAEKNEIVPYILGLAGFLGVVISVLLWRFRKSDREFERQHLKRLTAAPAGAIEALDGLPTFDVNDALRQLAEADAGASTPPTRENAGGETTSPADETS